jgi:hypothetical protein
MSFMPSAKSYALSADTLFTLFLNDQSLGVPSLKLWAFGFPLSALIAIFK